MRSEKKEDNSEKTFEVGNESDETLTSKVRVEEHDHSSSIVHEGVIDVEAIDKNKDGKLWECPMDWNVISDESGRCPLCNMKLKEFTIEEVKTNLDKHGFEYKKTHPRIPLLKREGLIKSPLLVLREGAGGRVH